VTWVVANHPSASSCLRSPAGQSITGIACALAYARNATAETTRHAHQMGVVQSVIGACECLPPGTESTRRMAHPEVGIEDDTIDAIVTAEEKILVKLTESIRHSSGRLPMYRQPVQAHGWRLLLADS
jgi:hypothetical protein